MHVDRTDAGDEQAWSLFSDRKALERRMTDEVRNNVAENYGVAIPSKSQQKKKKRRPRVEPSVASEDAQEPPLAAQPEAAPSQAPGAPDSSEKNGS